MKTIGTYKEDGKGRERALQIDAERLVTSGALITAGSGGGKSYLLRVLLEQLGRSTPIIVLDDEGDFPSLGEKLDVVQVGSLGELPTEPHTARMLCRRLIEKRLSAVIDLSEIKIDPRREYVHLFLDELVNLPRRLWRPTFIALDEAHRYAPEKGHGEAESTAAVIDASTLGRKRAFSMLFATQRIGKFHKDAAADRHNRFFGNVSLDIDIERSAKDLGMPPKVARETLRELEPGEWYAYGPAINAKGVVRFRAAKSQTKHPRPGEGRKLKPPKPSSAIKAVLKDFADLPREAEQEIKDLAAATSKVAELERELKRRPKEQVTRTQTVEVSSKRDRQTIARFRAGLEEAMKVMEQLKKLKTTPSLLDEKTVRTHIDTAVRGILKAAGQKAATEKVQQDKTLREVDRSLARARGLLAIAPQANGEAEPPKRPQSARSVDVDDADAGDVDAGDDEAENVPTNPPAKPAVRESLTPDQRKIVDAIAFWEGVGVPSPNNTAVALKAGWAPTTSSYTRARGQLRSSDFITFPKPQMLSLTTSGRDGARTIAAVPSLKQLHKMVCAVLEDDQAKVLRAALKVYPDAQSNDDLAKAAGDWAATTSSYTRARGKLRTMDLIEFRDDGVAATDVLFPEELR